MRIIFDLRKVGLGNNGGSNTIINSSNTLQELGHEVFLIDSMRNRNTWVPIKTKHRIINKEKNLPNADVIIATGYKSVGTTLSAPNRCGKKASWIRGWETWVIPENKIVKNVIQTPTIKLVNSVCLKDKLKQYKVNSHIIRPGYELEKYIDEGKRNYKEIIIGGLYNTRDKRKRTAWILEAVKRLKSKYKIKLYMYGANSKPDSIVDHYISNPSIEQKVSLYNKIHIWLAPTNSEGLHMPPAEALLCGCVGVRTNAELCGMQEYLIDKENGLISENNFKDFMKKTEMLIRKPEAIKILSEGSREYVEKLGDRKTNMKKLVKIFGEKND